MNLDTIAQTLRTELAVALYFSTPTCGVCRALKPKLLDAFKANFSLLQVVSIDIAESPEISAYYSVFTIPTLLVYLDGKEFLRKSRYMSVGQVTAEIKRPYDIMTS